MEDPKLQLIDKLKAANNILVSVSANPSVDQLAAMLGLTLALNKLGKHGTAVFSGQVPSTMEFLQPEDTIETNTDSLRDFIIALDKSKADKLRYKVEDDVVRIFITPYRTSISDADLEFSQGDFNVDVVVALGVSRQEDLDQAIVAHGRILHDATVTSINVLPDSGLGSINWNSPQASSLSELVVELTQSLAPNLLDEQISNALLTGIVAETQRFSNAKTTPQTMSMSALLMSSGANQQLVASKLEEPVDPTPQPEQSNQDQSQDSETTETTPEPPAEEPPKQDGELEIKHDDGAPEPDVDQANESAPELVQDPTQEQPHDDQPDDVQPQDQPEPALNPETPEAPEVEPQIITDPTPTDQPPAGESLSQGSSLITEPPILGGGVLTANSEPEALDPSTDPLSQSLSGSDELLSHDVPMAEVALAPEPAPQEQQPAPPTPQPEPLITGLTPPPPAWVPPMPDSPVVAPNNAVTDDETLTDIESAVDSPHLNQPPLDDTGLDAARDEVLKAFTGTNDADQPLPPIAALNANPMLDNLHAPDPIDLPDLPLPPATPQQSVADLAPIPADHPALSVPMSAEPTAPTEADLAVSDALNYQLTAADQQAIPTLPLPPSMPAMPPPMPADPHAAPPVPPPLPFNFGGTQPPAQ